MRFMLMLGGAVLAASCSATTGTPAEVLDVSFSCTNGETLAVRFIQERNLAILTRGGVSIELPQQISGSGFIYSNGPYTIRGKGDDLTVEIGRMMPLQCRAK